MTYEIWTNGTIDFEGLTFYQAKILQTAIRRLLYIDKKRNQTENNDHILSVVDDACDKFSELAKSGKIKP